MNLKIYNYDSVFKDLIFECKSLKTEYRFNECVGFRFSLERR